MADLILGTLATLQSASASWVDSARLSDTKTIVAYVDSDGLTGRLALATTTSTSISWGAEQTFDTDGAGISQVAVVSLTATLCLLVYTLDSSGLNYIVPIGISGSTISVGTKTNFDSEAEIVEQSMCRSSDTEAFLFQTQSSGANIVYFAATYVSMASVTTNELATIPADTGTIDHIDCCPMGIGAVAALAWSETSGNAHVYIIDFATGNTLDTGQINPVGTGRDSLNIKQFDSEYACLINSLTSQNGDYVNVVYWDGADLTVGGGFGIFGPGSRSNLVEIAPLTSRTAALVGIGGTSGNYVIEGEMLFEIATGLYTDFQAFGSLVELTAYTGTEIAANATSSESAFIFFSTSGTVVTGGRMATTVELDIITIQGDITVDLGLEGIIQVASNIAIVGDIPVDLELQGSIQVGNNIVISGDISVDLEINGSILVLNQWFGRAGTFNSKISTQINRNSKIIVQVDANSKINQSVSFNSSITD